jgi:hypothetical protein
LTPGEPPYIEGWTVAEVLGALVTSWASWVARAGDPFQLVEQLDVKLVRGQSTKEDVRRLLGKPDQKGDARFPPSGTLQEVWYYQEQKIHSSQWNPEIRDGRLQADAEQRELFVLFTDGRFDGYLWYGVRLEGEDLP